MHMQDILLYGHMEVMNATEKLSLDSWELPNACGVWSVKNIIAHLASYELFLLDVLNSLLDKDAATPTLKKLFQLGDAWSESEVEQRKALNAADTFKEYQQNHEAVMQLVAKIPAEIATKAGAITWYGENYDLEDFVVYTFYGHKREHSAQINAFRDSLKRSGAN